MKAAKKSASMWHDSMKVGLPALDQERRNTLELLELLEMKPLYSVASEAFASRFSVVQAAIEKFLQYEESLMISYGVPDKIRRLHLADHDKIRTRLYRIQMDSVNKRNQTVLDVYRVLRNEIKKHVLTFGAEMSKYVVSAERMKDTVKDLTYATEASS